MIVLKFGGTSVGSSSAIRRVGCIIQERLERQPFVVVSAVGGVTDRLFELRDLCLEEQAWEDSFANLCEIHRTIMEELELDAQLVDGLLEELKSLLGELAAAGECTPKALDHLVSFGERMSSRLVAGHLQTLGIESCAVDAFDAGLVTDGRFQRARPLDDVNSRIQEACRSLAGVVVATGYIARDEEGNITTLGRGGSDYTASIFGAALGSEEIQIWTDVDGVMTADPRIVENARPLATLSFEEAAELAFYGARVIHPATMIPAVDQDIPIRVLNTHRPDFPGTLILADLAEDARGVKSITSKSHVSVVNIVAPRMLDQYGFLARVADVFSRFEVVVDIIATSEVSIAFTTQGRGQLDSAIGELKEFCRVDVYHDREQISVVGEDIRDRIGFASEVFDVLGELKVNVELISFGATRINLSFLVGEGQAADVVRGLHRRLFES